MSLAFRRRYLLRQAEFRYAVLRIGHAAQKCKNPTETNPAGFSILATSYSRTAYRRTTIGAAAFHCRVRNGDGWGHCATVTRVRNRTGVSLLPQRRKHEADSLGTASALQFLSAVRDRGYNIFERT